MTRSTLRASSLTAALATLLTLYPVFLPAQSNDSEFSRHYQAARNAQAAGDLDLAVREYQAVIQLQPGLAEARVNLALVLYLQANYEASARSMEKALSLKPGVRGADLFLGIDYAKLGQSRQAVMCLRRAVAQEPNNKQAQTWLGSALWDAGQENESVIELRDAARLFRGDPDILFLLGQAYRNLANEEMERVLAVVGTPLYHQACGDIYREQQAWAQAIGHYQRALERDPQWVGAHLGLAEVWLQQGKLDQASSELALERGDGVIVDALSAEIAVRQGDAGKAVGFLKQAIEKDAVATANSLGFPPLPFADDAPLDENAKSQYRLSANSLRNMPSSPARHLALAVVDMRLGLVDESATAWEHYRALATTPVAAGDAYERARRAFERHDFESARTQLLPMLASRPREAQLHYLLARTNRSLSLALLADMLSASPDSPRTHQLMGQTLAERSDNSKALAEYRIVEAAAPTLGGVHFAIGELLWKMDQTAAAMAEFQQELHLNPGHAEASAAAGTILVSEHQADQAMPYFKKALQLKPGLLLAHQELGKAYYQRREFASAEQELKKAAASDPEGSVRYLLGNVYKELGREQEAAAAFAESRRIKQERLNAVNAEKAEKMAVDKQ
jgi:tetratricopeptide (TPR) repeat protein